jgi:hypothetical protein
VKKLHVRGTKAESRQVRFWDWKRAEDGRQGVKTRWGPEKEGSIDMIVFRKIVPPPP